MTTKGAGPLVWVAPVLDIAGKEYKVQKLGLPQIGYLAKIYTAYSTISARAVMLQAIKDPTLLGTFLVDACAVAYDEVVGLLASVIGLDTGISDKRMEKLREEHDRRNAQRAEKGDDQVAWNPPSNAGTIRDPETFPLDALVDVIEAVIEHDDVIAFFDKFVRMMKGPALKKLVKHLNVPSTASKKDTAGRTNKS